MPPKYSKKNLQFQREHAAKYGLKITSRHSQTSAVSSVACRFCIVFGKEEAVGRKRKATANVKYFNSFRTDNYESHIKTQHAQKWEEYRKLQTAEKEAFFVDHSVPWVETMTAHFEGGALQYLISKSIVEVIIGELLFHPDDVEGVTHSRALSHFKLRSVENASDDDLQRDEYVVIVKTPQRFLLCIRYMGCGAAFRLASRLLQATQEQTGLSYLGGCSDIMASNYSRIACAVSLQILSDVMSQAWAFSIALDCSTHQGMSYLDVRSRVHIESSIQNFHLLAIPLFDRHTAANMFVVLEKFLDALLPNWRKHIIGVSTDGDRTMTGRIRGLATRIEEAAQSCIVRVWCGLHQLDLKMQIVFERGLDEEFLSILTALIGYLRRQQNLVTEMRATCPKVANTRWLSMGKVSRWLCGNRVRVRQYLDEKQPACSPPLIWWMFLFALNAFVEEANSVFVSLQGLNTLLSQQRCRLLALVETYCRMSGMKGPLIEEEINQFDPLTTEICGQFALTHRHARACLDNLGVWIYDTLADLPEVDVS